MTFLAVLFQALLLVLAISTDAFVAGIAYGASKIKIPLNSLLIIGIISTGMLALSLFAGDFIAPFLPDTMVKIICFSLLFLLGIIKLFDGAIKASIKKHRGKRSFSFSALQLNFILQVYAEPEAADSDKGGLLSPREALSLSAALSLDGLAAGFGASLTGDGTIETIILCFLLSLAAVKAGQILGQRLSRQGKFDLSVLSGLLLITLAFLKL